MNSPPASQSELDIVIDLMHNLSRGTGPQKSRPALRRRPRSPQTFPRRPLRRRQPHAGSALAVTPHHRNAIHGFHNINTNTCADTTRNSIVNG